MKTYILFLNFPESYFGGESPRDSYKTLGKLFIVYWDRCDNFCTSHIPLRSMLGARKPSR